MAVAFQLESRRDFGQGLIAARPGPARGGAGASVWGLSLRINRGAIISWTVGLLIVGTVFGLLSTTMIDVLGSNPAVGQVLARGATTYGALTFGLLITLINLLALMAAVYGVGIANRVHTEEVAYRIEPLLAGGLSRSRYLFSNVLVALFGPAVGLLMATAAIGLIAATANEAITLGALLQQGLLAIPALWLLIGVGLAAVGANPKLRLVAWLAIVATFGLTLLGPSFNLPTWALGISPLWHIPNLKSPDHEFGGLIVISLIAALLLVVSFAGFRRRDII
jgi:ABC-2 type transport system permease protein